jgi:hypothetical protein
LPQESFSDCIWYTYIDFNEKPPYFRYDTGDNTAKENESTYYEIQEELKQFGYTIEDVYIDHDTICGDIVSINKELAQPQGEWVDLTPHEVTEQIREGAADGGWQGFAQRITAKFKEKNTPKIVPQGEPVAGSPSWEAFDIAIQAAIEATKEKAAKVCEDEATKCEKAAQACIENDEPDEVSAVRSTGWKLMVCAAAIRSMK